MNAEMVVLRVVHILLGVFWAGTLMFFAIYLEPSVREAGPDGAKVVLGLQKRKFLNVMPIIAALTILSGLRLYWIVSAGFASGWVTSPYGVSLTLGGIASIVALTLGVLVMRRSTIRAGELGRTAAQNPSDPGNQQVQQEIANLRLRARTSARWVAALLGFTVVTMSIARYL